MTERANLVIAALRSGHDRLAARVQEFTADDLARVSGSSEWDVSQVLSHLGSGAEISRASLEAAVGDGPVPDSDFMRTVWARWDGMSRAERAETFLSADELQVAAIEKLSPQERTDLRITLAYMPEPVDVASFASMRLSEFALHHWDVEVAFDASATLAAEEAEILLGLQPGMLGYVAKSEALSGRTGTVAVRLTDPAHALGLRLGEPIELTDEPAEPDAVLAAPTEYWVRLVAGRHAPEHTPGTVAVSGAFTLDDLRGVFPSF
jgi:uncharacterized protein (TIGR03083 family)